MEEILASIRRIIADDQDSLKPADAEQEGHPNADHEIEAAASASDHVGYEEPISFQAPPPAAAPLEPADDLDLRLPEILFSEVPPREPEQARQPDPAPDPGPTPPPAPEATWTVPPVSAAARTSEGLISTEATAHIGQTFNMLSQTVLAQNARTLEDLVQGLLKPMLKTWLDDNLPPLVERLVRAEIERVARGRG